MLQRYPENALLKLEFDKIVQLLLTKCTTEGARKRIESLPFQTNFDYLKRTLNQVNEMLNTFTGGDAFPSTTICNLEKELQLLTVINARLQINELVGFRKLCHLTKGIFQWFKGKKELFPTLFSITENTIYKPEILKLINPILDEQNQIKDDASPELAIIRKQLLEKQLRVRRVFEGNLQKLSRLGYLTEIRESFLNGRRCVAVLAEQKRVVKGILHGESDSGKTVFIEPENTVLLNNEITLLSLEEKKETGKILTELTRQLSVFQTDLSQYYKNCCIFDFIQAKALLAKDLNASLPVLIKTASVNLIDARHPLLFLKNKKEGKITVPLNVALSNQNRILMISGPNAGGKTVAMKTIGLLQLMLQSGLLIPVDARSEMGIFHQLLIHLGDTQSIENELSTYSAHLKDMNYFLRFSNGRTLFFIDELGSGSDPYLGGCFAEAIVEELVRKHAFGVITTHYFNLKTMAAKTKGMQNAAMLFDEKQLLPLYQLSLGKPGSSYTFAIAKRSGIPPKVIDRAKLLADSNHLKLDQLLLDAEQQVMQNKKVEKRLSAQLSQSRASQAKYEALINKETFRQQTTLLQLQNQIKKEELDYLRDTERKFRQLVQEWKKSGNKQEIIQQAEKLLFKKKQNKQNKAAAQKADRKYETTENLPEVGALVRNKKNHQIGIVEKINEKNAIVKIGKLPFTVNLNDWVVVVEKGGKE